MPIKVACDNCGSAYRIAESSIGKEVRCKKCGKAFIVADPKGPPPLPSNDPFENAVFATPKAAAPAAPKRWTAAIETHALPKTHRDVVEAPRVLTAYAKSPRRSYSVGLGGLAALGLLLVILGPVAGGIYASIAIYNSSDVAEPGATILHVWGWIIVYEVLFFALIGPSVFGVVYATSKIFGFQLGDAPYLRSCGAAAIPAIMVIAAGLVPMPFNVLIWIVIVPASFWAFYQIFEMKWFEAAAGYAMAAIAFAVTYFVTFIVLGVVVTVSRHELATGTYGKRGSHNNLLATAAPSTPGVASAVTPARPDDNATDSALADLKATVNRITAQDLSNSTREDHEGDVSLLRKQLDALRPHFQSDPEWPAIEQQVAAYQTRVLSLPSGRIDPSVFEFPTDVDDWTTGALSRGKLSPEVSYRAYRIQPPRDLNIDLTSSEENADGLAWTAAGARLSIKTIPRGDTRQKKPVIAEFAAPLRVAREAGLLVYDGNHITASYGSINGMPFARMAIKAADVGEHWVEYVSPQQDSWLVIRLTAPTDAQMSTKILEASVRTVRRAEAGEARANPFASAIIAPRLAEDFARVSKMLRDEGPSAEAAVAAQMESPDRNLRQKAAELLQDIGTEKSVTALKKAVLDEDATVSTLARAALRKIEQVAPAETQPVVKSPSPSPPPMDLGRLVTALNSPDGPVRRDAVGKLTFVPVDPKTMPEVSRKLAGMLRGGDPFVPINEVADAMCVWGDPAQSSDLFPLLLQDVPIDRRRAAMRILGAMHADGASSAMVRWLKLDPIPTADGLIAIGPGAEQAVLPFVRNADPAVRIDAARILSKIGSKKSIENLKAAAADRRDAAAADAAQQALSAVRQRIGK